MNTLTADKANSHSNALALREQFPEGAALLTAYSPDRIGNVMLIEDKSRIYEGTSPELSLVSEAYGENIASTWLQIQLQRVSEFNRDSMDPWVIKLAAALILSQFSYLKLSELMLFFGRLMSGAYGRFYGQVNPQQLLYCLRHFLTERNNDLDAINRQRTLLEKQQAHEAELPYLITSTEWDRRRSTLTRDDLQRMMVRPGDSGT